MSSRTKIELEQALKELMLKKPLNKITIHNGSLSY